MMDIGVAADRSTTKKRIAELYRQHAPAAMRLAFLITRDAAEAEDLVHDAFVRVLARFADLRSEDAFAPYLKQVVVNLATSRFRKRRVERAWRSRHAAEASVTPGGDDPVEAHTLWQQLLQLPERQRCALVLRFYEDLSEAQTADILRCPRGTVKSLVARGLAALREEVTP